MTAPGFTPPAPDNPLFPEPPAPLSKVPVPPAFPANDIGPSPFEAESTRRQIRAVAAEVNREADELAAAAVAIREYLDRDVDNRHARVALFRALRAVLTLQGSAAQLEGLAWLAYERAE